MQFAACIAFHYHSAMQPLAAIPLTVTEIDRSPAFRSGDPEVVRASLYLLDAAWRTDKPGTLCADLDQLAHIARLSLDKLQSNWDQLFDGWVLQEDGRLCHPRLSDVWQQMSQTYGDALRRMELAALVMQADASRMDPEGFELLSPAQDLAPVKATNKGKKIFPADFQPNEASVVAMERSGYATEEERQWLLQRFGDFGRAQRRMYADWQAAFRNFLGSSMTKRDFRDQFGYAPGARPVPSIASGVGGGALARLRHRAAGHSTEVRHAPLADTFAQRQLGNARTMFAAAAANRGLVPAEPSHLEEVPAAR